jgi:predicted chitinase
MNSFFVFLRSKLSEVLIKEKGDNTITAALPSILEPLFQQVGGTVEAIQKDLKLTGSLVSVAAFSDPKFTTIQQQILDIGSVTIFLLLQACRTFGVTDPAQIAYIIATVGEESALGVKPIESSGHPYGSQQDINYFSLTSGGYIYRGRGYIQITHDYNYTKFGQKLGLGNQLLYDPGLAKDPLIAAKIAVLGMRDDLILTPNGSSQGLGFYINSATNHFDYRNARSIVQGGNFTIESADKIENMARKYYQILK